MCLSNIVCELKSVPLTIPGQTTPVYASTQQEIQTNKHARGRTNSVTETYIRCSVCIHVSICDTVWKRSCRSLPDLHDNEKGEQIVLFLFFSVGYREAQDVPWEWSKLSIVFEYRSNKECTQEGLKQCFGTWTYLIKSQINFIKSISPGL